MRCSARSRCESQADDSKPKEGSPRRLKGFFVNENDEHHDYPKSLDGTTTYEFNSSADALFFFTRAKLAKPARRSRQLTNRRFPTKPNNHGDGRRWSLVRPNNVLGDDPWLDGLEGVVAEVGAEGPFEIR